MIEEKIMEKVQSNASGSCPVWMVEVKRRMAKWRQQLSMAKALVHGEIVVEVAARKGLKISAEDLPPLKRSNLRRPGSYLNGIRILWIVQLMWCLVSAAREAGVDVDRLVEVTDG